MGYPRLSYKALVKLTEMQRHQNTLGEDLRRGGIASAAFSSKQSAPSIDGDNHEPKQDIAGEM